MLSRKHYLIFSLFIFLFLTKFAFTQPELIWSKDYRGEIYSEAVDFEHTEDSGYIILGSFQYFNCDLDVWLVKTDINGDTLWTKKYGGDNTDIGNSVLQTDDSGYIIVGHTESFPGYPLWIIKTDSLGDTLWTKRYNGKSLNPYAEGFGINTTIDGGYIITGITDHKLWLLKTNSEGDTLWTKIFWDMSEDCKSIHQTPEGDYLISGQRKNEPRLFLMKTDSLGTILWNNSYRYFYSVLPPVTGQPTTDGGYIMASWVLTEEMGYPKVYIQKTNEFGDTLWTKIRDYNGYGGFGLSVDETKDNSYIIAGGQNLWFSKISSDGDVEWIKYNYNEKLNFSISSIQETFDYGYILAGRFDNGLHIEKYSHEKVPLSDFNPPPDTLNSAQTISITSSIADVEIHYTLDSSDPDESSSVYSSPISLNNPTTIKAIGYKDGWLDGDISTAFYDFKVADISVSRNPGSYSTPVTVSLSSSSGSTSIYYTLNGSEPTQSSTLYTGPFEIDDNMTLKAKGYRTNWQPSNTFSGSYTIAPQVITVNIETDPVWYDWDYDAAETNTLYGNGSSISYGSIESYEWLIDNEVVATTENYTVELPTGTKKVVLRLTSDRSVVKQNYVNVNVYAAELTTNGAIHASVSQLNNNIFFISSTDDKIYKFDSTGTVDWTILTGGDIQSTTCVSNQNNIFVGSSDTRLYSFSEIGIPNWDKALGGIIQSSPSVSPNGIVYVGINTGRLLAIREDETIEWSYQTGDAVTSSPSISEEGNLYFGSHDGCIYALDSSGDTLWTYQTGGAITSSPAVGNDSSVVIGSNDEYLYKFDKYGDLDWTFDADGQINASPVIGQNGTIYVGSGSNNFYAVSKDGDEIWAYNAGVPISGTASIDADGNIYFGCNDGRLIVLDDEGNLLWYLKSDDAIDASPLITPNGLIYAGSTDGKVYILKKQAGGLPKTVAYDTREWPTFKGNFRRTGYSGDAISDIAKKENILPKIFKLQQNYPNPFNPTTTIVYELPKATLVKISVYNLLGQKISNLVNQKQQAGHYSIQFNGFQLPSGLYYCTIKADEFSAVKKMLLIK